MRLRHLSPFAWTLLAVCAALNVAVGFIVQALRLPIYLDSIGTIIAAVLVGPLAGALVGVVGLILLSLVTAPTALAYSGTAIIVALAASLFARWGYLRKWPATVLLGLVIGVLAAVVSAPVTTYLFGGVSLAGADAATAFFSATGQTLLQSVLLGGIATDPVDKLITSIICHLLILRLPRRVQSQLAFVAPERVET